jgi:hypothetical protein
MNMKEGKKRRFGGREAGQKTRCHSLIHSINNTNCSEQRDQTEGIKSCLSDLQFGMD